LAAKAKEFSEALLLVKNRPVTRVLQLGERVIYTQTDFFYRVAPNRLELRQRLCDFSWICV